MKRSTLSWLQAARPPKPRQPARWRRLWRVGTSPFLVALVLALVGLVALSGELLAADVLALSAPWRFVDESKPGSPPISGELAVAAAEAPAQVAAHFELHSTMEALALQLADAKLGGVPLAQVEELSYCTHLIDSPLPYAVTLQLNIDADVTDGDNGWQGRLVYSPADNGAIIQGEWQCWDTLAGKWWATGGPLAGVAKQDSPQSLATFWARFPNLGVNAAYAVVALKAGDGWSNFEGEASPVVIGLPGEKIEIAFAGAAAAAGQENEVLLPVLLNEAPTPQPPAQHGRKEKKKPEKDDKNDDNQGDNQDETRIAWRAGDWAATHWVGFDWQNFDWDKVDWQHLNWGAFGWGDNDKAEAIRAFVADVQQCKAQGWQGLGFHSAGDCVAYYAKAHTPANLDWSSFGWGRTWMQRDGNGGWNDDQDDDNQRDRRDDNGYRGYGHHNDDD